MPVQFSTDYLQLLFICVINSVHMNCRYGTAVVYCQQVRTHSATDSAYVLALGNLYFINFHTAVQLLTKINIVY